MFILCIYFWHLLYVYGATLCSIWGGVFFCISVSCQNIMGDWRILCFSRQNAQHVFLSFFTCTQKALFIWCGLRLIFSIFFSLLFLEIWISLSHGGRQSRVIFGFAIDIYIICSVSRLVHILVSFYYRVRQTAGGEGIQRCCVLYIWCRGCLSFDWMVASRQVFVLFPRDDSDISGFSLAGGKKSNSFGDSAIAVPWIFELLCD